MSALNVCNDICRETGFFLFPWQIYRCVTTNISAIKPQSKLNLSYFPKGSFGGEGNRTFY